MAYCVYSDVTKLIPTAYDSTTRLPDAYITSTIIPAADDEINNTLAEQYGQFNDTGDTPATPPLIAKISRYLSAAQCMDIIGTGEGLTERIDRYRREAAEALASLLTPGAQMDMQETTGETLTFGDASPAFEIGEDEALIGYGASNPRKASVDIAPNIASQSVKVASATGVSNPGQLRNGVDFGVRFDREREAWIFTRYTSELKSAATITVDYQWDYRRLSGLSRRVQVTWEHA